MTQQGSSNRLLYDACACSQNYQDSISPFKYVTYYGAYENANKCQSNGFWRPFDPEIVDIESELKNITRPASKCVTMKYVPTCKKNEMCTSTFQQPMPATVNRVCPVVYNNIPRQPCNGLRSNLDVLYNKTN